MSEIKRVLFSKKSIMFLGILLFLHATFFYYQCNEFKSQTLTGEQLRSYVDGYHESVAMVSGNAAEMLGNPLYSSDSGFVYRNIIKTSSDYQTLLDVTPVFGENRGIETLISFQLTGYLMILMGVFYVLSFMAERQKGLYLLVRCTCNGRLPLSLLRICSLVLGITGCGLLFFLSILPIMLLRFPGSELFRPVQSLPEFSGTTAHVTILGYLFIISLRRILGCLVICTLLYFCMSLLRSSLCVPLFLLLFFMEWLLYAILLPTDQFCILKFVNLYTYVFAPKDYGHYLNLNLFGRPVLTGSCSDAFALIIFAVLALACLLQYSCQYPKADGKRFPRIDRLYSTLSKIKPQLTPFLWECKKILISQKAVFILLIFLYLAWSSSTEITYRDYRSIYETKWYQMFAGSVDEKKLEDMDKQMVKLKDRLDMYEKSLARQEEILQKYIEKGYETWAVTQNISSLTTLIQEYKLSIQGLNSVTEHARSDYQFTLASGISVNLIDPSFYELLLRKDYQTVRKNYLYVLLAIILMFSGVMACETSSNLKPTLHVLYRGGRALFLRKIIIVFLMSIVCALSIHLLQFFQIRRVMMPDAENVIAQSIPCVRYLPVVMTIRTYLILLYSVRALIAFVLGLLVMLISNYSKSRSNTIALSIFLLGIPMILLSFFFSAAG